MENGSHPALATGIEGKTTPHANTFPSGFDLVVYQVTGMRWAISCSCSVTADERIRSREPHKITLTEMGCMFFSDYTVSPIFAESMGTLGLDHSPQEAARYRIRSDTKTPERLWLSQVNSKVISR